MQADVIPTHSGTFGCDAREFPTHTKRMKTTTKKPTLSEIRAHNLDSGHRHFSRENMRVLGETMRNYVVGPMTDDGKIQVFRNGGRGGNVTFLYDPATGEVRKA